MSDPYASFSSPQTADPYASFSSTAPVAPKQSWLQKHGRELASGAGGIVGAVIGAPVAALEAIPTMGIGSLATEMGAAGLGAGMGGQAYDLAQRLMGHKDTMTAGQRVSQAGQDVLAGSSGALGGQVIGGAVKAAAPAVSKIATALSTMKNAGPVAEKAIADLRGQAVARALEQSQAARRAQTIATTQGARATQGQTTAQTIAESPQPIGVGNVTHLSEQGAPGQQVAQANAIAAQKAKAAAFKAHEESIDNVLSSNEAKGIYVNDLPQVKATLKKTQDILSPNPATAPTAAPRPTMGERRAYKMVQDALMENKVPLTAAQAEEAQGLGYKVDVVKGGGTEANPIPDTYFRRLKTPLEAVTNLRRLAGDAGFSKEPVSGFEGIASSTWKSIYHDLSGIEDAATEGLSQVQKDAYKAALANAEKFSTGLGKKITATEGINDVSKMPASRIPSAVIGGGADTYNQFKAITNPQVAVKFANDAVETALHDPITNGPKSFDAAKKAVAKGTPLGDVIHAIPELEVKVQQHLNRLLDAKNAGVQAEKFGQTASKAATAQAAAEKARLDFQSQVVQLQNLPNDKLLSASEELFNNLAKNNKISRAEQDAYIKQIRDTSKKFGAKQARNQALKWGARIIGGAAIGGAATEAGIHAAKVMGQ